MSTRPLMAGSREGSPTTYCLPGTSRTSLSPDPFPDQSSGRAEAMAAQDVDFGGGQPAPERSAARAPRPDLSVALDDDLRAVPVRHHQRRERGQGSALRRLHGLPADQVAVRLGNRTDGYQPAHRTPSAVWAAALPKTPS